MKYALEKSNLFIKLIIILLFFLYFFPSHIFGAITCDKLQIALKEFRKKNHISGMGLYIKSPKALCYLFSGSVKRNAYKKITKNNLWQIASITKSYFSTITLQLEAASEAKKIPIKFNINQKLQHWLPQYSAWGQVTIKQLLNMTSGIYSYTNLPISKMVSNNPKKVWRLNEIIHLAYYHKPNIYFPPGKGWRYSDTNYILIGQVIQKVYQKITGRIIPLNTILQQHILNKLQLNNTYYYPAGLPNKLLSRMAHGYNYYTKQDFTALNLSIAGPAGAMISTPKDVANWVETLFSGKILPQKQMREMRALVSQKTGQPILPNKTALTPAFSLGLMEQYAKKLGQVWLYEGVSSGYTAFYFYIPKSRTIISYTASVGSIKKNPIQFSKLAENILQTLGMPLK